MNLKTLNFACLLSLVAVAASCTKSDPVTAKVSPTDFVVTSQVSSDGSGIVSFTATAVNASQYTFTFGEPGVGAVKSNDGSVTHTYAATGTYSVKVVATSRDGITADFSQDVSVTVHSVTLPTAGFTTPDHYDGMNLIWQDEFGGTSLNTAFWNYETGASTFNGELEYYQADNTSVHDGYLFIEARKQDMGDRHYTSSRLTTAGKKEFKYGRVDIRAVLPKGQGMWPALWMLGASINTGTNWPACGEIDIMEMIGGGAGRDNVVHGTTHWDAGGHKQDTDQLALTTGIFADEFHVFSLVWNSTGITYYLDNVAYNTTATTDSALSEFQAPFFFIFNVAVGGDWPGNPNDATVFPQKMLVDYIRVFQ